VIWSGPATPLARMIMGVTEDPALLVSHVNGDRLDYRRENLVVRTRSESRLAAKRPKKWEGLEPYLDPDRVGVVRVPVQTELHKGMMGCVLGAARRDAAFSGGGNNIGLGIHGRDGDERGRGHGGRQSGPKAIGGPRHVCLIRSLVDSGPPTRADVA
jgi:hypothetical protein